MNRSNRFLNRRDFLKMAAAGATASALPGCGLFTQKEPANFLFIAIDDLRPELGCYGQSHVINPNIDRLANNGITFNSAYCQSAVCNPSRASLLTGLRPDTIKVWDLNDELRQTTPDAVTLPQHFKNKGYHSVGIGKIYHNVIPDPLSWSEPKLHIDGYPFDPDAVYRKTENIAWLEARKQRIRAAGREKRHIDRLGQWYLKAVATESVDAPDNVYYDGAQTDVAIEKLAELKKRQQPFFFGVGYYRPHLPFNAPKKYWDLYEREKIPLAENDFLPENAPPMAINNLRELRGYTDFKNMPKAHEGKLSETEARRLKHGYLACVSYIDAQVGRLLDTLEKLDLAQNTIIVLWGDHGWKLGEHNSWCKMTNYEIDTRVPLIFSTPDLRNKAVHTDALVEFVDVYPTLCELAGLPLAQNLQGLSAVPLFHNPQQPWKKAVFSQFLREGIWIAPDGIEYMGYSMRTERYRLVEWFRWDMHNKVPLELAAQELYDHHNDPNENVNIAARPENREVLARLVGMRRRGWQHVLP